MIAALKSLLVSESAEDGHPLFANSAKLAEAIAAASPQSYKNPKTTAALLNFVFRCERSCSDSLRDAILKAVRTRLAKQPRRVQDDWIQRVGRAADALSGEVAKAQQSQSPRDEDQFDALLTAARAASEHFIVTATPAELEEDDLRPAAALNSLLIEILGLFPILEADAPTRYRFLLPSEVQARDFWYHLKVKVEAMHDSQDSKSKVAQRLTELDEKDALEVYVVPTYICGCPIVVFNPSGRFKKTTAFTFGYHDNNVIDCVQWHDTSIDEWKRHFHNAFHAVKTKEEAFQDNDKWNAFYGYRYTYKQSQQSSKK